MIGGDPVGDFRASIRDHGMDCHNEIVPGVISRFPGEGKNQRNRAGWALLFDDLRGGVFGDYSTNATHHWQAVDTEKPSPAERRRQRQAIDRVRKQRQAELEAAHRETAHRAADLWSSTRLAPDDRGYPLRKQIGAHGAHADGDRFLVSVSDLAGRIQSIQFIGADGKKLFMRGGKVAGGVYRIGEHTPGGTCIICEGFATAATIHEQSGHCVLAAFSAKNLKPVALAIRQRYPSIDLVIAGDNDRFTEGNPGVTAATDAARASGARLLIPEFPEGATGTDFNDLANWYKAQGVSA